MVLAIVALALIVSVIFVVLGLAAHLLFSPWLLLVAVAVFVWFKFGPRRSRQ